MGMRFRYLAAFAALSLLSFGHSNAQTRNVFGATIRNPGSIVPEWWNEERYIPEHIGESLHLRQGSSGDFGGSPQLGRNTCDLPMLYSAVSRTPLTPAELESCALTEYDIYRGVSGDNRNLNDVFVRRDTIAQFSQKVLERIALFRNTKSFYLRASAIRMEPYRMDGGFLIQANWGGNLINVLGATPVTYHFEEAGHFLTSMPDWWGLTLNGFNDTQAREIEGARSSGRFVTAANFFRFEPVSAREVGTRGVHVDRYVRVVVTEFTLAYRTSSGAISTLGWKPKR